MTFFIGWWRHDDVPCQIFLTTQSIPEILYHDFITLTSLLVASVSGSNVQNLGMKSAISDVWPIFIDLWRPFLTWYVRYFLYYKHSRDVLLSCHHCDIIISHLGKEWRHTFHAYLWVYKCCRTVNFPLLPWYAPPHWCVVFKL